MLKHGKKLLKSLHRVYKTVKGHNKNTHSYCRTCSGNGVINATPIKSIITRNKDLKTCRNCGGSGLIEDCLRH